MREDRDAPLAPLTTLGLGGPAERLITAYDEQEVVEAVRATTGPLLVLGSGSNVVLPDEGFAGTVIRVASSGITTAADDEHVLLEVQAGHDWDALVAHTVREGLAGMECLSGIPGLVGGTPIQNVGAYGQDVAQTITAVRVLDRRTDEVETLTHFGFGYRWSRFKADRDRWVVLAVTYRLRRSTTANPVRAGDLGKALGTGQVPLGEVREAVLALRRSKGMVVDAADPDTRSAGSFFTNPVVDEAVAGAPSYDEPDGRVKLSAAWLIEQAGFTKGSFDGPVGLSTKHTLAIVHRGGGTTQDLLRVARTIRDGVQDRFGITLEPEPVLVGASL